MASALDRSALKSEYEGNLSLYSALKDEAVHEITHALEKSTIKYHSVSARIKSFASICRKAEDREFGKPLSEITDIVGTRVVTLFLGDVERITTLLSKTFDVIELDNKIDNMDAARFGYLSVHLLVRFRASYVGTRYDHIKQTTFEIQVRTIAMDAWASASRYLDYKTENDIPKDLKRDFHALSGLFYVADRHFEMFFRSRQKSLDEVKQSSKRDDFLESEINLDTLTLYLKNKYPDRLHSQTEQVSKLVSSLIQRGITTLATLDSYLDSKATQLVEWEKAISGDKFTLADVGMVRISFSDDLEFEPGARRHPNLRHLKKTN